MSSVQLCFGDTHVRSYRMIGTTDSIRTKYARELEECYWRQTWARAAEAMAAKIDQDVLTRVQSADYSYPADKNGSASG